MTRGERQRQWTGLAFILPWMIGFVAFTALPIGLSFYYSLCDYSLLQPPVYVGLANYRELLADGVFWKSLFNTGLFALMALPGGLMLALALAMLLNLPLRGQALYRTIVFLPSLVPLVASAMLWLWIFNGRLGLLNDLLRRVGIEGPNWLGDPSWAMPALAVMSLWGVGHTVVILLAGLQDVPRELVEAARIDGAGPGRCFWHVTLPMVSPVIFFNLIMGLIGASQVFAVPYIMTAGGPDRATYFFAMFLYDNAFAYLKMGHASAMAWILFLIVLGLTATAFWTGRRWVHYQGR